MPDGLLQDMDLEKHLSSSNCDYTFPNQQSYDSVQFSGTPFNWESKNYYSSPVGKFWDRSASSSGSSENRLSSNPELTCFPIEEDPSSNEESENDQLQEEKDPITVSTKMEIVTKENDDDVADEIKEGIVPKIANQEPPSGPMKYRDRCSSNSVNVEVNIPKTHDKVKYKSKFHPGIKYEEENRTPSIYTRGSIKRNASSLQTQNRIRRNVSLQTQNSKNKAEYKRRLNVTILFQISHLLFQLFSKNKQLQFAQVREI
ncbi:hypothetical protein L1887_40755 [Cichorium endivia]|nr:hypothetical protein L1887_40755 [Cichorium endivia]